MRFLTLVFQGLCAKKLTAEEAAATLRANQKLKKP